MEKFSKFARIAEIEFSDVVLSTQDLGLKLRVYLVDKSFIDFFYTTETKTTRFSIHWERSHIDGKIYRLDSTPDTKWRKINSFPIHFHSQKYERVINSPFIVGKKIKLEQTFRSFLLFTRNNIKFKC